MEGVVGAEEEGKILVIIIIIIIEVVILTEEDVSVDTLLKATAQEATAAIICMARLIIWLLKRHVVKPMGQEVDTSTIITTTIVENKEIVMGVRLTPLPTTAWRQ